MITETAMMMNELWTLLLTLAFLTLGMAKSSSKKNDTTTAAKTVTPKGAPALEDNQTRIVKPDADTLKKWKAALSKISKKLTDGVALQDKVIRDLKVEACKMVHNLLKVEGKWEDGHLIQTVIHPLYNNYVLDWDSKAHWWRYISSVDGEVATMSTTWVKDPYGKLTPSAKKVKRDTEIAFLYGFTAQKMPDNTTLYSCPGCSEWVKSASSHKCYTNDMLTLAVEVTPKSDDSSN
jgi:hypothetical protein